MPTKCKLIKSHHFFLASLVLKMNRDQELQLEELYLNSKSPSGFTSASQLYRQAKSEGLKLSHKQIRKWLESQDLFTAYKPAVRRFLRRRVIARGYMDVIDGDVAFLDKLEKENDGIKYWAVFICVFSRQCWVYAMKDKTAETMLQKIKQFLKDSPIQMNTLRVDYGGEYSASIIQEYLESREIYLQFARNPPKSNYAERLISSLKNRVYKYMYAKQTNRYIDHLDEIVQAYNDAYHRGIKRSPSSIGKHNEVQIFMEQYVPKTPRKTPVKFKLKKNDLVRLVYPKETFARGFYQKFSEAIFVVKQRFATHPPTYKIKDQKGLDVGSVFYEPELSLVRGSLDTIQFKVEKILQRRTRKTKKAPSRKLL